MQCCIGDNEDLPCACRVTCYERKSATIKSVDKDYVHLLIYRGSENLVPDKPSIPDPWVDVEPDETASAPQRQSAQSGSLLPPPQEVRQERSKPETQEHTAQQESRLPSARREPSPTDQMLARMSSNDDYERPEKGFRRFVYNITKGRVNPGLSKESQLRKSHIDTLTTPLPSGKIFFCGYWSQKGGIGKTTSATAIGATMATYRTDKILGLDVNPDGGSMALRIPKTSDYTILDLRDELRRRDLSPMEFDTFVNHNPETRFDAIVMPPGEKPSQPLMADDFQMIADALFRKYPYRIVFVDCGTDLTSPVMDAVIPQLDLLVTVTTDVRDEAVVTNGGLHALAKDGYSDLVKNSVTMMVHKQLADPDVQEQRKIDRDVRETRAWFRESTRTVVDVPYDSSIRRGGIIDLNTISRETEMAYLRGAAEITTALKELR